MQVCLDLQILSAVTTLVKLFAIFEVLLIPLVASPSLRISEKQKGEPTSDSPFL